MPSRKAHTKSFNGCGQCKRRHVKCDFQAPTCSNCKRRHERCDYELLYTDEPLLLIQPSMSLAESVLVQLQTSPTMLIQVTDKGNDALTWEPVVLQEIGKHAFLKEAFGALSTLYRLQQEQQQSSSNLTIKRDYMNACTRHLEAARIFRETRLTVAEHGWVAPIMFAMSTVIFQFRVIATQPGDSCEAETMLVLRSAAQLAKSTAQEFLLAQFLKYQRLNPEEQSISPEPSMHDALSRLAQLVHGLKGLEGVDAAHVHAVQALRQWFKFTQGHPRTWLHFIWWPAVVEQTFIDLLAELDPVALIIFVHWCALMANAPNTWSLDGWIPGLAKHALSCLGPEWRRSICYLDERFGDSASEEGIESFGRGSFGNALVEAC